MSLETRVETLEHELKILKNEIESTLVEIQNQVLIHYYPALRAEESAPPKEFSALADAPVAARRGDGHRQESLENRSLRDDSYPLVSTKEVSLQEITGRKKSVTTHSMMHPMPPETDATPAMAAPEAAPWSATAFDQAALPFLAKWVNDSVARIGKRLTCNVVRSSAGAAYATPEIIDLLLQFVTLAAEENPPEQVSTKELMDVLLKLNKVLDQVATIHTM
jgi:hypothetical protein